MKHSCIIISSIVGVIALAALVVAVIFAQPSTMSSSSNDTADVKATVAPNTVEMRDFAFGPEKLTIKKGQSYSFTFNNVDAYEYICSPHPHMTGSIEVIE